MFERDLLESGGKAQGVFFQEYVGPGEQYLHTSGSDAVLGFEKLDEQYLVCFVLVVDDSETGFGGLESASVAIPAVSGAFVFMPGPGYLQGDILLCFGVFRAHFFIFEWQMKYIIC